MTKKGKIIRNGIEYTGGGGSASNIEYLTQEAYDALPESKLTNGIEYRITDANTSTTVARNIAYDNSESGIEAVSVQDAIDVMNEGLIRIGTLETTVTVAANNKTNQTIVFPKENVIGAWISCYGANKNTMDLGKVFMSGKTTLTVQNTRTEEQTATVVICYAYTE